MLRTAILLILLYSERKFTSEWWRKIGHNRSSFTKVVLVVIEEREELEVVEKVALIAAYICIKM